MTTIEVLPSDPTVKPLLDLIGAQTRRTVKIEAATRYQVSDYWSEGSRNEATFIDLATLQAIPATSLPTTARQQTNNPFNLAIGEVTLAPGYAVLEHVYFQGKDLGYRLYVHPDNIAPMLPQGAPTIDPRDKRILEAMRSLKPGPYRQEALTALAYTTEDRDRLALKGLVKVARNGATQLTLEGKQASR